MDILVERISVHKGIVDLEVLKKIVNTAKKIKKIKLTEKISDISTSGLMILSEQGKALDFLKEKKEDIYTINDLKVRYK